MRDARLTRRTFLAGAVGASAAFALPGVAAPCAGRGQARDLTSSARAVEGEVGRPPANVAPVTVIGGTTYAIPWYIMPAFWYVWRDVFEKNNVKLPSTFDEAKAAAAAL